jgi:hypothetical protein
MLAHPHPDGLQDRLNLDETNPILERSGLNNGDLPAGLRQDLNLQPFATEEVLSRPRQAIGLWSVRPGLD